MCWARAGLSSWCAACDARLVREHQRLLAHVVVRREALFDPMENDPGQQAVRAQQLHALGVRLASS
jgi:hypothetical protein